MAINTKEIQSKKIKELKNMFYELMYERLNKLAEYFKNKIKF